MVYLFGTPEVSLEAPREEPSQVAGSAYSEPAHSESGTPQPAYGPVPRVRARIVAGLAGLPWAALLSITLVIDVAAILIRADLLATAAVFVLVWTQVPAARRRSGPAVGAVTMAVARRLVVGTALLVTGFHVVAGSAHALLDDTLRLGAVAVLVALPAIALDARQAQPPRVLLVGDLPQMRGMVARWMDDGSVRVVGGLALGVSSEMAASGLSDLGIASLGTLEEVADHLRGNPADLVVVAPGASVTAEDLRRLSWRLQATDTRLAVSSVTDDVAPHRIEIATVGGSTVELVAAPGGGIVYAAAKQVIDRVLGMVLLVAVSPVLAVAALAIRLDSPGPALFRQVRIGRDGVPFTMYKLRTMTTQAEDLREGLDELDEGNGVLFKMRNDPRVTRVGGLLRRTSLDELPQLFNVVLGSMSLIGPRPALPEEVAKYSDGELRRLAVKPGITGLWQVSGRSLLNRERSMWLDTSYVDDGRASTDASILVRTVTAVVTRRGAF